MNIRQKLLSVGLLLAIVPTIIISIIVGYYSIVNSKNVLEEEASNKLIATRNAQKNAVETYFESLGTDLKVMADNLMVIEAMKDFNKSFGEFDSRIVGSQQNKSALMNFYQQDFTSQYASKNTDELDAMNLYDSLSPEAEYYQQQYIALNDNPLGSKGLLDFASDQSSYSAFHRKYHKVLRNHLEQRDLHDMFLIEPISGNVVYSTFKEVDYATSLKYGPFRDSGLGRAFAKANNGAKDTVYFEDYQSYVPSYNDQVLFVSTPIFENDVQIGVLAYQVKIDKLNEIMTFAGSWKDQGLGQSGETYLVGPDGLLRNESRFFIEDKDNYLSSLTSANVSAQLINEMGTKNTSIGIQKVDTTATKNVFNGQTGLGESIDYRGVEVLTAYTPVNVFDVTWALISEIDTNEAFRASSKLSENLLIIASVTALFLILLAVFAVLNYVEMLSVPLADLDNTVRKISQGDTDARTSIQSDDEFGKLGQALNQLLDEKESSTVHVEQENEQINNSVIGLLATLNQITDKDFSVNVPVSDDIIGTVAASLNALTEEISGVLKDVTAVSNQVTDVSYQVQKTSNQVIQAANIEREQVLHTVNSLDIASEKMNKISQEANNANKLAETTIEKTKQALLTVQDSNAGINSIRETIFGTEKRIKRLGDRSQEISGIVKLINNIAERTHILALNASMHAASAGEAGRGFAVVADEVQRLAESAKDSTEEISTLVNSIRTETIDTVNAMNNVISQVAKGTELAENAGAAMSETNEVTESLVSLVQQISEHANEQAIASEEIKGMAKNIELSTRKTEVSLDQQKKSTTDLVEYSNSLKESVNVFTLPE